MQVRARAPHLAKAEASSLNYFIHTVLPVQPRVRENRKERQAKVCVKIVKDKIIISEPIELLPKIKMFKL